MLLFIVYTDDDLQYVTDSALPAADGCSDAETLTLKDRLEQAIASSMARHARTSRPSRASVDQDKTLMAAIKAEMAVFSGGGERGKYLEGTYQLLLTIPPTSVEAERTFS